MTGSYDVLPPSLIKHAKALTGLADELKSALAAAQVAVTGDAYGQVGTRVAAALNTVARAGQDTLRTGVEALDKAATEMHATATTYDRQDATGRAGFNRIAGERP
jgi:Excreted virulence factor EspC, type VII ESX diderm